MSNIVCFGEILWDVFPNHKKIGGAPLNVALRAKSFDNHVAMISAIGNDHLGKELLRYLKENGINTDGIQVLDDYKTGEVKVVLDEKGSASYTIEYPSAYDKIELKDSLIDTVKASGAVVFGSLITRDDTSKETLYKLLEYANYKIFDLNLRPPHFSEETLIYLMEKADFIKFNDDELYEVSAFLGSKYNSLVQNIHFIAKTTNTKRICVTKGAHGAVLLYDGLLYYNSGYRIKVVDTVGAGDSFLGTLVSQLLNKINPQEAIDYACSVGALVAQSEGANPKISKPMIDAFLNL
ncbi:carbohydrate kinase [Algibacter amylolyticus]|uniref:Carbohydrate kinase n=1 Tax=Algibacter amylolyticus TaxID=1608400 RepID=A0A5M7B1D9_9FLAO|nr:carbohydrate kinase [Algibacter amylolyticus]KAA5823473.1 carbohydrate kinase [Algibacter amylolyticus]MBB5267623.1 fructokinase [Algibacter amylolyticus]TSJ73961.1 carbohydrate kinase [Algibacter amylolyticus]